MRLRARTIEVSSDYLATVRPPLFDPNYLGLLALLLLWLGWDWRFCIVLAVFPLVVLLGQASRFREVARWAQDQIRRVELHEELEERVKSNDLEAEWKKARDEYLLCKTALNDWVREKPTLFERFVLSRARRVPEHHTDLNQEVSERGYIDTRLVEALSEQRREARKSAGRATSVTDEQMTGSDSVQLNNDMD